MYLRKMHVERLRSFFANIIRVDLTHNGKKIFGSRLHKGICHNYSWFYLTPPTLQN